MPDLAWLLSIAFGVGALIGAVGIGGVLLIPALAAFAALPIQTAMATALFTFTRWFWTFGLRRYSGASA